MMNAIHVETVLSSVFHITIEIVENRILCPVPAQPEINKKNDWDLLPL